MKNLIKSKRVYYGITQQELANLININRAYLSKIENNQRTPSVKIAKRIAYELDFDWTLFFKD